MNRLSPTEILTTKRPMSEALDISRIEIPAFLLNAPLSLSTDVPNNVWMMEQTAEQRRVDKHKALRQFHALYAFVSKYALTYLLPSRPGLQDQTFVSNLGVVLPHLERSTAVISRFRSEPRVGEAEVGIKFFRLMNFSVHTPPEYLSASSETIDGKIYFEGEADLKCLRENIYIGGYGIRTSRSALRWFSTQFDMKIIPFRMTDDRLFHLDACLLLVSPDAVVVCTEIADKETVREIENCAQIIDVSREEAHTGVTNCLILGNEMLYASDIDVLPKADEDYAGEVMLNAKIEAICNQLQMEPRRFDLSEFYKSGGGLACMIMHLNYANCIRKHV